MAAKQPPPSRSTPPRPAATDRPAPKRYEGGGQTPPKPPRGSEVNTPQKDKKNFEEARQTHTAPNPKFSPFGTTAEQRAAEDAERRRAEESYKRGGVIKKGK